MSTILQKSQEILTEKNTKILSGNLKSGVTAFGVTGSLVELKGETKTITPTTSQQVITPSSNKNGITQVTVNAVTSAIDGNIQASNIKKNVSILGVTGNYEGSGGGSLGPTQIAVYEYDSSWALNQAVTNHTITPSVGDWAIVGSFDNPYDTNVSLSSGIMLTDVVFQPNLYINFENFNPGEPPSLYETAQFLDYSISGAGMSYKTSVYISANDSSAIVGITNLDSSQPNNLVAYANYNADNPMEIMEYGSGSYTLSSVYFNGTSVDIGDPTQGDVMDKLALGLRFGASTSTGTIGNTLDSCAYWYGRCGFIQNLYIFTEKGSFSGVFNDDNKYVDFKK